MDRSSHWTWIVAGLLFALSVAFFFRYKDPMILAFGVIAGGLVLWARTAMGGWGGGAADIRVRLKCRECQAHNLEDAKYCSQCGRPV